MAHIYLFLKKLVIIEFGTPTHIGKSQKLIISLYINLQPHYKHTIKFAFENCCSLNKTKDTTNTNPIPFSHTHRKTNSLAINCLLQFISIFSTTCSSTIVCQANRPPMHHQLYQYASSFVSTRAILMGTKIFYIQHIFSLHNTIIHNSTESNLLIEMCVYRVAPFCLHFSYSYSLKNNKSRAYDLGRFDKTSNYVCECRKYECEPTITFLIVHCCCVVASQVSYKSSNITKYVSVSI